MMKSTKFVPIICHIRKTADYMNMTKLVRHVGYIATAPLPLPSNVDSGETTRFSPNRSRDISGNHIISHQCQNIKPFIVDEPIMIDVTADNTKGNMGFGRSPEDPHVQSYDCQNPVSLNAVMQSNVPQPYGSATMFSHLNMPGGQWSQEGKFIAQNLKNSHLTALRTSTQALLKNEAIVKIQRRFFCIKRDTNINDSTKPENMMLNNSTSIEQKTSLSKKEQLKLAFKEYGATAVIFHITISLASLGGFYVLVSSGINMMEILQHLGLADTLTKSNITAGASTFVVAYAIHKIFAPFRITITLGATPFIVRFLRSKNILKNK